MSLALITLAVFSFYIIGCASPETMRTRGGGPGADVGNRAKVVEMHEGSRPFWRTPDLIPSKHPPLEPANQAAELSRR